MASPPGQAWAGRPCAKPNDPDQGALVSAGLETGEILQVSYRGCDKDTLLLEHPLLGLLSVPRAAVVSLTPTVSSPASADSVADDEAVTRERASAWLFGLELGLNGASGNSESYNLRFSARAQRRSNSGELSAEITYLRSEAASKNSRDDDGDGVVDRPSLELTDSEVLASLRNDWLATNNPWRYFLEATVDADQFKDYDLRWSVATGPGYTFFKDDDASLVGRIGAGLSEKLGGEDQSIVPELLFGGDGEKRLAKRQQLTLKLTVYPDLSEFGELRSVAQANWDIDLDPEHNLKLRLGIEDRYDSKPEDEMVSVGANILPKRTDHNDLDYYATLLLEF